MRRIFITCALASLLAVPAVAVAGLRAAGDGTLDVKDGVGLVQIKAKGGVIGRFSAGALWVRDPNPDDAIEAVVTGYEDRFKGKDDFVTVYTGKNVRFRYIGGNFKITVKGLDIDLSAVGKGKVMLQGAGSLDDGTYSFNDEPAQLLPVFSRDFNLGAVNGTTT